ncbi:hypothetical protein Tco_1222655 [Tanacetum coccineum]
MLEKYPITIRQTYDMVNGKWKTVRPKVAQICGVYHNVTRRALSGSGDGDYTHLALLKYQAKSEVLFTLTHCWAELKDCEKWNEVEILDFEANEQENKKRYKSSESNSFNTTQSSYGSFNLNMHAVDDEEEDA